MNIKELDLASVDFSKGWEHRCYGTKHTVVQIDENGNNQETVLPAWFSALLNDQYAPGVQDAKAQIMTILDEHA